MKIYMIGAGGVGGFFGAKLALVGNDLTFVARGEHYNAIKENGLKVKSVDGDFQIHPAKIISKISEITNPDVIFVTVKTYDLESIIEDLRRVLTPETIIITLENGVFNDLTLKNKLTNAAIFPGIAYVISSIESPGVINQTGGLKKIIFGDRRKVNNLKLGEIEKILQMANIDAKYSDDIERDLWRKFIFINAFSGVTAICRSCIGKIREDAVVMNTYKDCVRESIQVAKKLNINLPDSIFEDVVGVIENMTYDSKSSLLIDIERNGKNEIETLNGTLVRLANENGIEVPINSTIYSAIKILN